MPVTSVMHAVIKECRPDIDDDARLALQPGRCRNRLHQRQRHRAVARVLDDLAPAGLALFPELLKARQDVAGHLHDNGRRNVRHDAERKDTEARQGAAREQVEQRQHVAGLLVKEIGERRWIHTRHRDKGTRTEYDQRANKKQEPGAKLAQFSRCFRNVPPDFVLAFLPL